MSNKSEIESPGWFGRVRDLFEAAWKGLRPPSRKRLELRFLSYAEADKLIRETSGAWTIAKEEDNNRCIGWVYLERREDYPHFALDTAKGGKG